MDVKFVKVIVVPSQSTYVRSVVTGPTLICHSVHGAGVGIGDWGGTILVITSCSTIV